MLHKTGVFFLAMTGLLAWQSSLAIAESDLYVVTTADFETGSTALLRAGSQVAQIDLLAPIHGDAVARYHGGMIYIIERFLGDNIIVLNPADLGEFLSIA